MVDKLMTDLCKQAKIEWKNAASNQQAKDAKLPTKKNPKVINLDYADNVCQKLFAHRQHETLSSRIKFKIQDLIDNHNKEWRFIIAEAKSRQSDSEGFQKITQPKEQIITEENGEKVFSSNKKGYFYRAKSKEPKPRADEGSAKGKKETEKQNSNKMANLLSCLKAGD